MPPKDKNKKENNKQYVEVHEELRESSMYESQNPTNINLLEDDSDEVGAVQAKEKGGRGLDKIGNEANIGGGSLVKTTDVNKAPNTLSSSELSGLDKLASGPQLNTAPATELNETVGNNPTNTNDNSNGEGTIPPNNGDNPELEGGASGNLNPKKSDNELRNFHGEEEEPTKIDATTKIKETAPSNIETLDKEVAIGTTEMKEAARTLKELVSEAKTDTKTGENNGANNNEKIKVESNLTNISPGSDGSLVGVKNGNSNGELGKKNTSNNNPEATAKKTQEETQKTTEDKALLSSDMGDVAVDLDALEKKVAAADNTDQAELTKVTDQGIQLGQTAGLGRTVNKDPKNPKELIFGDKPENEDEIKKYLEEEKSKCFETIIKDNKKLKTAFINGFSEGYSQGQRLKREIDAVEKKREQSNDPDYQKGLKKGTEAGSLALSDNAEQKMMSKELTNEAYAKNEEGKYIKSESYRKAFMQGFNESFYASQVAAAQKAQAEKAELMTKPNYKAGYDLGHKLGIAEGREVEVEGISDVKTVKNNAVKNKGPQGQDMDAEGLYKKGFLAGFNNGWEQGTKVLHTEKQAAKKDMRENENNPKFIFYTSGALWGTLSAMGLASNAVKDKAIALEILMGKQNTSSFGEGFPPIPEKVKAFFKAKRHLTEDPVDKKLFNKSFIEGFNNSYSDVQQKRAQQAIKQSKKSDEYQQGSTIGETVGDAAFLLQKFRQQINKYQREANQIQIGSLLQEIRTIEDAKNLKPANAANLKTKILTQEGFLISNKDNAEKLIDIAIEVQLKIIPIKINVDKISEAFNATNINKDYKKGYINAYSEAYQKAMVEESRAEASQNENLGSENNSDPSAKAFQEGRTVGTQIGSKIKELLDKAWGNTELTAAINAQSSKAYKKAEALSAQDKKGPNYLKGFKKGFEEGYATSTEGGQNLTDADQADANILEQLATKGYAENNENLSQDQENLQESFNNIDSKHETYGSEYLKKGFDFAYNKWYEYNRKPETERSGKEPNVEWIEKKKKLKESIDKELKTAKRTDGKADQLALIYENGYLYGTFLGKKHAHYYLLGYNLATQAIDNDGSPELKEAEKTQHYKLGVKAGKEESAYQNFRAKALGKGGLIKDYKYQKSMTEQLVDKSDYYIVAYRKAYNIWLKAFLTHKGLSIPSSLENINFELPAIKNVVIESSGNSGGNGSLASIKGQGGALGDRNLTTENKNDVVGEIELKSKIPEKALDAAGYFLNNTDILLSDFTAIFKKNYINKTYAEGEQQHESTSNNATERHARLEKIIASKITTTNVEEYRKGISKAIEDAQVQSNALVDADQAYHHGVLAGYASTSANKSSLPTGVQEDMKEANDRKSFYETEAGVDVKIKFQKGFIKGIQLGSMVTTGALNKQTVMSQLGSAATQEGYRKGVENANTDISTYRNALMDSGERPDPELEEAYKELAEDQQESYKQAYQYTYALGRTYEDGYSQGYFTATNNDQEDDYRLYNYEVPKKWIAYRKELPAKYQNGIIDGREQGFLDKYVNSGQSKELAFHRRINQIRENESLGNIYADAYESGYREGVRIKGASGANVATVQMVLENEGPKTMAADFKAYIPNYLKSSLSPMIEGLSEKEKNKKIFFDQLIHKVLKDALKILDNTSKSDKERLLRSTDFFLEGFDRLILDSYSEEDRNDFQQLKITLKKEFNKYLEGYIKGARKGTVEGIDLDKAQKNSEKKDLAVEFQQQMMKAVVNEGNDHYIQGYQQAREIILKIARDQPDVTTDQLIGQRYKFAQIARKNLILFMSDMSKKLLKNRPSPSNINDFAHFREQKTGLLHIINHLPKEIELDISERQDQDEFIEEKIHTLLSEVKHWIEDFHTNTPIVHRDGIDTNTLSEIRHSTFDFFIKQLEEVWTPFIDHYRQGFNAGYVQGIDEVVEERTDDTVTATGLLGKIYEQLKAGKIQDGDIANLDWLSTQHLMLNEIYKEREQAQSDSNLIYSTDIVIIDLLDEIDVKKLYRTELKEQLENNTNEDNFAKIIDKLELLDEQIIALEEQKNLQEEQIHVVYDRMDNRVEEFRQFTRQNMHFETAKESNEAISEYLLDQKNILSLDGTFNDQEGNAKITGSGKLVFDDRYIQWEMTGNIFIGLGDLELTSSGAIIHHTQYFVELQAGEFKVPFYDKNGRQEFKALHENTLELEMGIGMLEQIDQQMHLNEKLSAGAILLGNVMNWFGF